MIFIFLIILNLNLWNNFYLSVSLILATVFFIKINKFLFFFIDFLFLDKFRVLFFILIGLILVYLIYIKFDWREYFYMTFLCLFFFVFFLFFTSNLFNLILVYEILVIFILLAVISNRYQFERFSLLFYLLVYMVMRSYIFIFYLSNLDLFFFFC